MAGIAVEHALRESNYRRKLSFLFKDAVFYGATSAISKAVHLITTPLFTRVFAKSEFAVVDGLAALGAVFLSVVIFGQDSAVARYYYRTDDPEERKQVVAQSLLIEVLSGACLAALLLAAARPLLALYFEDASAAPARAFWLLALSLPFAALVQFWQNLLKWTFARGRYFIMTIGMTLCVLVLLPLFLLGLHLGVEGVFAAFLATHLVFAAIGFSFCRKLVAWPRSAGALGRLARFGWPYMALGVAGALVPSIDRYFLNTRLGLETAAVYAVAYKVSMALKLPLAGFQVAWGPFAYAIYKDPDAASTYNRVLRHYAAAAALFTTAVVVLAEPIVRALASGTYLASVPIVLPLAFAVLIESLASVTGIGIDLAEKPLASFKCYVLSLLAALAGIAALVAPLGVFGVALGLLLGKSALTLAMTFSAYRLYPLRFALKPVVAAFVLGLAAASAHSALAHWLPEWRLVWAAAWLLGIGCLSLRLWRNYRRELRDA
jgi:O-antigen/teichoic acid export membrane protein